MILYISYAHVVAFVSALWLFTRACFWIKEKKIDFIRELKLLLVYFCLIVVLRFTFFPFSRIDGKLQYLIFDPSQLFPFRTNFVPFVYLFNYPKTSAALLNLIGNILMFIPLGIVWPTVFNCLNTHIKVLCAGFGASLCIEILQLPFHQRVSDIDDLILNTSGFIIGYIIYLVFKKIKTDMR